MKKHPIVFVTVIITSDDEFATKNHQNELLATKNYYTNWQKGDVSIDLR